MSRITLDIRYTLLHNRLLSPSNKIFIGIVLKINRANPEKKGSYFPIGSKGIICSL